MELRVREYGERGPLVVVLHGGPAAAGNAAPIARGLSDGFRVLEPWQRGSGDRPLTVADHVRDLHELVYTRCGGEPPALVGESWGAMLALAYAAEHPDDAGPLALIGCGTFDEAARARLRETLEERQAGMLERSLAELDRADLGPEERLRAMYALTRSLYDYDPIEDDGAGEEVPFDVKAHAETWEDMVRLQAEGVYPAAFRAITSPVLMLHGTHDPHPGRMIRDSILPFIPRLEYREFERCGHSPWLERAVREEFLTVLREWLKRAPVSPA